jgi:hypothetical protein
VSKRLLGPFLLCSGVVALSGTVMLAWAGSWLHEPGAQLFGVRPIFLIWFVVLLEAPFLAWVSARSGSVMAGFLGTVAGAAALTWVTDLLGYIGPFDLGVDLAFAALVIAGLVALPVAAEFGAISWVRDRWQRHRNGSGVSA